MMLRLALIVTIMITVGDNVVTGAKFKNLKAVTYNTALVDVTLDNQLVIPNNRIERRYKIIEIFNSSEADIVCLQEVWIGEDVEAIVGGVKDNYPYSFSSVHRGSGVDGYQRPKEGPVCDANILLPLLTCGLANSCFDSGNVDTNLRCIAVSCAPEFTSAVVASNEQCYSCIITTFPYFDVAIKECGGIGQDRKTLRKTNTNGMVLLSKTKLRKAQSVQFYPSTKELIVRGYLSAKAAYNFSSYADLKAFEVSQLIATFGAYKRLLLLGDFNAGPDYISGKESYEALVAVFNTKLLKLCTFCSNDTNPYNSDENEGAIDHVFGKGIDIRRVERVYTQSDYSVQYNSQDLPLSDHYGVEAKILPQ